MKAIIEFFMKLFGKSPKPETVKPVPLAPVAPAPVVQAVPVAAVPVERAKVTFDYKKLADFDWFHVVTRIFPDGLPTDFDIDAWVLASGKPDPRTHDTRNRKIEPMPPFIDPPSLTDHGEMDIKVGQSKEITITKPFGMMTFMAHAPQYHGQVILNIGGVLVESSGYNNTSVPLGTHTVTLVSGPTQGMRLKLWKRDREF